MNKREFVDLLSEALSGRVPDKVIRERIEYYRSYISDQVRDNGESEEDVIDSLGTPESIARTIVDTFEREYGPYVGGSEAEEVTAEEQGRENRSFFSFLEGKGCLIAVILFAVLFVALGSWIIAILASNPWLVIVIIVIIAVGWKRNGGNPPF